MKSLILSAIVLSIASVPVAVCAADAPTATASTPRLGTIVWSADGKRIGPVDNIRKSKDGTSASVGLIYESSLIYVPISTLSTGPKGLATSLSLKEARGK